MPLQSELGTALELWNRFPRHASQITRREWRPYFKPYASAIAG